MRLMVGAAGPHQRLLEETKPLLRERAPQPSEQQRLGRRQRPGAAGRRVRLGRRRAAPWQQPLAREEARRRSARLAHALDLALAPG